MDDWFSEKPRPQHTARVLESAQPILRRNRIQFLKSFFWVPVFAVSTLAAGIWIGRSPSQENFAFLEMEDEETQLLAEADFELIENLEFIEDLESEDL